MNKSKKLNEELKELVVERMYNNLFSVLEEQEHEMLCLDNGECDRVYAYLNDGWGSVREMQVCFVAIIDGRICVYLDEEDSTHIPNGEFPDINNDKWYELFGSALFGWFALMSINEVLHEFI